MTQEHIETIGAVDLERLENPQQAIDYEKVILDRFAAVGENIIHVFELLSKLAAGPVIEVDSEVLQNRAPEYGFDA